MNLMVLNFKKNIIFYGPLERVKHIQLSNLPKSFILRELLSNNVLSMDQYLSQSMQLKIIFMRLHCMLITAMKISSSGGGQCLMEKLKQEERIFSGTV